MLTYFRRIGVAPSPPAECFRCVEAIDAGSLAIASVVPFYDRDAGVELRLPLGMSEQDQRFFSLPNVRWFHPACALDVDLFGTMRSLQKYRGRDAELERVYHIGLERRRVANAIIEAREGGRAVSRSVIERVEPTRDRKGRPRVSVLAAGSGTSATSRSWLAFDQLTRDRSIVSPLREYVVYPLGVGSNEWLASDPSQPIVAAVFMALEHVKVVKAQQDKLAYLRSLEVPTPLLWVLGVDHRDRESLDQKVLELREALNRAGFVGDEAGVVASVDVDEQSLAALAAALDGMGEPKTLARARTSALRNALDALEASLEAGSTEGLSSLVEALSIASKKVERSSNAEVTSHDRLRIGAALARCVADPSARRSALTLLRSFGTPEHAAHLCRGVYAMFDEPGRTLSRDFDEAYRLLKRWRFSGLDGLVVDGLLHWQSGKLRRAALARRLARCADGAQAQRLLDASSTMKRRDARVREFESLAAAIRARATARKRTGRSGKKTSRAQSSGV